MHPACPVHRLPQRSAWVALSAIVALFASGFGIVGMTAIAPEASASITSVRILSPGKDVPFGWRGPIRLNISTDSPTRVQVDVVGPKSYFDSATVNVATGSGQQVSVPFASMTESGRYEIHVYDLDNIRHWATKQFVVRAPDVVVSRAKASANSFYPTIRDGYRDKVTFSARVDRAATVIFRVVHGPSRTEPHTIEKRRAGIVTWTWNGTDRAGNPIKPGDYRVRIRAINDEGRKAEAIVAVAAKTGVFTVRPTLTKTGDQAARRRTTGNCYANPSDYDRTLSLDCWGFLGGRHSATASWKFKVPKAATKVTWKIRGTEGCCDDGKIRRSMSRGGNRATLTIQVTGTRSITVSKATVSYVLKQRR